MSLAMCAVAWSSEPLAAQSTDSKPAATKSSRKKSKKKAAAKPPSTVPAKSVAKSSAKPAPKVTAKAPRKPPKPPPPAAEIPAVAESASVWRGCLESRDLPKLASTLGLEEPKLASLLEEKGVSASPNSCTAYVAATGGESGAASAIFQSTEPAGESRTIAFHKTEDTTIVTPGVCDCKEFAHRELTLAAREFMPQSAVNDSESIAPNVRWQLNILVPRMIGELHPKTALPDEEGETKSPLDDYAVRIAVGRQSDAEPERLQSIEIVDQASGERLNAAWWLDRADGPGVFIGKDGVAYERLLWESPVKYTRSSRGVGASTTTVRARVPAKKGSPKPTTVKTIKIPAYHLGVDMTAAKGTDVHAVGDAKVAFSGRRGTFGNLIILDHGRGYQTYYAHLSKIGKGIKAGATVSRGDIIGLVGSTGHSTAPHLHFETRLDGHYLDPFDESHQLGFWLLTADEQERLAMQLLSTAPVAAAADDVAARQH